MKQRNQDLIEENGNLKVSHKHFFQEYTRLKNLSTHQDSQLGKRKLHLSEESTEEILHGQNLRLDLLSKLIGKQAKSIKKSHK